MSLPVGFSKLSKCFGRAWKAQRQHCHLTSMSKLLRTLPAKVLLKDLNCRWGESSTYDGIVHRGRMNRQVGVHPVLVMASFLDPRFKSLQHLQLREKIKVDEDIYSEMMAVATESKYGGVDMTGVGDSSDDEDEDGEKDSCNGGPADKDMMDELLARYGGGVENVIHMDEDVVLQDKVRNELEGYKSLPVLPAFQLRRGHSLSPHDARPRSR